MRGREYTILIDKREKKPLVFPAALEILDPRALPTEQKAITVRLKTRAETLKTADYALADSPCNCYALSERSVIVETKRSIDEIAANCLSLSKRRNFVAQLTRMSESWRRPHLIVEGGLPTLSTTYPSSKVNPALALDALQRLCLEYGVTLIPIPGSTPAARRRTADYVARLLINGTIVHGR